MSSCRVTLLILEYIYTMGSIKSVKKSEVEMPKRLNVKCQVGKVLQYKNPHVPISSMPIAANHFLRNDVGDSVNAMIFCSHAACSVSDKWVASPLESGSECCSTVGFPIPRKICINITATHC